MAATSHYRTLLILAIAASIGVLIVATRLTSGYTQALARSLREQAIALSLSSVRDRTTRAVVWHTMAQAMPLATTRLNLQQEQDGVTHLPKGAVFDQDVLQILSLRSQEAARVARVLDPRNRLSAPLIAHVVALLESPALAGMAAQALSAVARDHAGALTDAMLDPQLNPWDIAALVPILAEAGATFCDWLGRPTIYGGSGSNSLVGDNDGNFNDIIYGGGGSDTIYTAIEEGIASLS